MSEPAENSMDLLERLFSEGLGADEAERKKLLDPFRAQHPELVAEVEALWPHHGGDSGAIDRLAAFSRQTWQPKTTGSLPEIDPKRYRIIEQVGQGGMGQVFKAEQQYPVARLVAIKVLPHSQMTPDRLARFAAEQRALALIDHPNVAAVFDCGQTEHGQPYYVMAYLEPTSITAYCDSQQLSISSRLALFIQVCQGMGQAHRKGIIHRDLNPANILISGSEKGPVPKIIDFGIAKFQDPDPLSSPTKTMMGTVMGTPGYMSPEQARGAGEEAIDTLSDIYSLGALLYELLVGRAPFQVKRKTTSLAGLIEALKTFVPHPPSHHMKSGETRAIAAATARSSDPYSLQKQLKRDLDWIVMKALERKPSGRYQTAQAFADDMKCYLEGRPVLAAPPQWFYRWRKLAVYHRRLVAGVSLFLITLSAALVLISLALVRARTAEFETRLALEKVEAVNAFTSDIFTEVTPSRAGRSATGLELVAKAQAQIPARYGDQPELEAATRAVVAFASKGLGDYERALENYRRVLVLQGLRLGNDHPEALQTMTEIAFLLAAQGKEEQAWVFYRQAHEGLKNRFSAENPATLRAASGLAMANASLGQVKEAEALFKHTLTSQALVLGAGTTDTMQTRHNFALFLYRQGRDSEAESLWQENLQILLKDPAKNLLLRFRTRHNLALLLNSRGNFQEAIKQNQSLLRERKDVLGPDHPETLLTLNNLAVAFTENGESQEAVSLLRAYLDETQNQHAPVIMRMRHNLGHTLMVMGDTLAAGGVLKLLWADRVEALGEYHRDTLRTRWTLGEIEEKEGRPRAAQAIFQEVSGHAKEHLGQGHRDSKLYQSEWDRRYVPGKK